MRSNNAFGLLALAAASMALAAPQGVTAAIAPSAPAPSECSPSHSGKFQITVSKVASSKAKRDALELTLDGSVLKDAKGRTGYIASNYQFQFDGPPQAGAIYTSGFSLCPNGTLALGGTTIWYQCLSGGFYNLYDRHWAEQCSPIYVEALGSSSSPAAAASQNPDGQPTAASAVSQKTDGQPIVTTAVSQQTDGQVIASKATANPVSQISDGQIQNHPTAAPVVSGPAVSQGNDGQVFESSAAAAPVSQISDGQIIASPAASAPPAAKGTTPAAAPAPAPVSQKSDGQPVATSAAAISPSRASSASAVSEKTDGQPIVSATKAVVNSSVSTTARPSQATVAGAARLAGEGMAVVAGLVAAVALL